LNTHSITPAGSKPPSNQLLFEKSSSRNWISESITLAMPSFFLSNFSFNSWEWVLISWRNGENKAVSFEASGHFSLNFFISSVIIAPIFFEEDRFPPLNYLYIYEISPLIFFPKTSHPSESEFNISFFFFRPWFLKNPVKCDSSISFLILSWLASSLKKYLTLLSEMRSPNIISKICPKFLPTDCQSSANASFWISLKALEISFLALLMFTITNYLNSFEFILYAFFIGSKNSTSSEYPSEQGSSC